MIPVASIENLSSHSVDLSERSDRVSARFSSEKELVRRAIAQSPWHEASNDEDVGVTTELETPSGIVDIAFFRLRKDWKNHAVVGQIPSRWAYAFHKMPYRKKFSTDDIASLAGTSVRRAKLALVDFAKLGLCRIAADGQNWFKVRQPLMALASLISVEAKLRDWRRALDQATRYLVYSDQAWVLLDDRSVNAAKENIQQFELRNVGLASISTSGNVVLHHLPQHSQTPRAHDRWVVNSELLKHIGYAR